MPPSGANSNSTKSSALGPPVGVSKRQNALKSNAAINVADALKDSLRPGLPTGSPLASPILGTRTTLPLRKQPGRESMSPERRPSTSTMKQRPNSPPMSLTRTDSQSDLKQAMYIVERRERIEFGLQELQDEFRERMQEMSAQLQEFGARITSDSEHAEVKLEYKFTQLQAEICEQMLEFKKMMSHSGSERPEQADREFKDMCSTVEALQSGLVALRADVEELNKKFVDVQLRVNHNAAEMGKIDKNTAKILEDIVNVKELSKANETKQGQLEAINISSEQLVEQASLSHEELSDRARRIEQANLGYKCSLERLERDFRAAEAQASRAMGETSALRDSVRTEIQESVAKETSQRDTLISNVRANSRFAIDALRRELFGHLEEKAALDLIEAAGISHVNTLGAASGQSEQSLREASEALERSLVAEAHASRAIGDASKLRDGLLNEVIDLRANIVKESTNSHLLVEGLKRELNERLDEMEQMQAESISDIIKHGSAATELADSSWRAASEAVERSLAAENKAFRAMGEASEFKGSIQALEDSVFMGDADSDTSLLRDSLRSEIEKCKQFRNDMIDLKESIANDASKRDSLSTNARFAVDALRNEILGRLDEDKAQRAAQHAENFIDATKRDAAACVLQEHSILASAEASERSIAFIEQKCNKLETAAAQYMDDLQCASKKTVDELQSSACTERRKQELLCLELQERAHRDAASLQASLSASSELLRAELCDELGAYEARCQDALSTKSQNLVPYARVPVEKILPVTSTGVSRSSSTENLGSTIRSSSSGTGQEEVATCGYTSKAPTITENHKSPVCTTRPVVRMWSDPVASDATSSVTLSPTITENHRSPVCITRPVVRLESPVCATRPVVRLWSDPVTSDATKASITCPIDVKVEMKIPPARICD